jgi:hypothetical protein
MFIVLCLFLVSCLLYLVQVRQLQKQNDESKKPAVEKKKASKAAASAASVATASSSSSSSDAIVSPTKRKQPVLHFSSLNIADHFDSLFLQLLFHVCSQALMGCLSPFCSQVEKEPEAQVTKKPRAKKETIATASSSAMDVV